MLDRVKRELSRRGLLGPADPVLVAVSGGIDSMVLLDMLLKLGHRCQVVHVDHGLRGRESDGDREFVQAHCAALGIECHARRVDPKALAEREGISVQMAARDLRQAALREVAEANGLAAIALAHHADDAVETLLMNLMRGTGTKGWGSIAYRSGPFIRPMLSVGRTEIEAHSREHSIPFHEDASNRDPKYLRNRVRHELIPLMEQLRPGSLRSLRRSVELLREMVPIVEERLDHELGQGLEHEQRIPIDRILGPSHPILLLAHLFQGQDLHPDEYDRMLRAMEQGSQAHFDLDRGQLWIAEGQMTLRSRPERSIAPMMIDREQAMAMSSPLRFTKCDAKAIDLEQGSKVAWLDGGLIQWPLELRTWQAGDRMRPVGLDGSKLISDILTDARVKQPDRDGVRVLISDGKILWLVGHRIAEGCAGGPGSREVLRVEWTGT